MPGRDVADRAEPQITSVPPEFFDALWTAPGTPPAPSEALKRRSARPRIVTQR